MTDITITATELTRANAAVRRFRKAEADQTKEALTKLLTEAIDLATVIQSTQANYLAKEQASDAKAKPASAQRLTDILGPTFEGSRSDVELGLSIPTDQKQAVALLTIYRKRAMRTKDEAGKAITPKIPTWPGFRTFVVDQANYYRAHKADKYNAEGQLTDDAQKARDKVATTRTNDQSTIIANHFYQSAADAHPDDVVEAAAEVRAILHDATASLAKLTATLTEDQRTAVTKRYREFLTAAKVSVPAAIATV